MTLRTFHVGGVAGGNVGSVSKIEAKYVGRLEIDELRCVTYKTDSGEQYDIVIGRSAEMRIVDERTDITLASALIPYGAKLYQHVGDIVNPGDIIADWDAYNAVILTEVDGSGAVGACGDMDGREVSGIEHINTVSLFADNFEVGDHIGGLLPVDSCVQKTADKDIETRTQEGN